jgi:hypothetical protein
LFLLYLIRILWQPRRGLAGNRFGEYKGDVNGSLALAGAPAVGSWRDEHPLHMVQGDLRHSVPENPDSFPALTSSRPDPISMDVGKHPLDVYS